MLKFHFCNVWKKFSKIAIVFSVKMCGHIIFGNVSVCFEINEISFKSFEDFIKFGGKRIFTI